MIERRGPRGHSGSTVGSVDLRPIMQRDHLGQNIQKILTGRELIWSLLLVVVTARALLGVLPLDGPGRPPPKGDLRLKSMCFWLSKRTMNEGTFTTCLRTRMCLCLMRTRA